MASTASVVLSAVEGPQCGHLLPLIASFPYGQTQRPFVVHRVTARGAAGRDVTVNLPWGRGQLKVKHGPLKKGFPNPLR